MHVLQPVPFSISQDFLAALAHRFTYQAYCASEVFSIERKLCHVNVIILAATEATNPRLINTKYHRL
jgi:hypothetical protein